MQYENIQQMLASFQKKELYTSYHLLSAKHQHPANTRTSFQKKKKYTIIVTFKVQIKNTQSIRAPFRKKELYTNYHIFSAKHQHPANTRTSFQIKKKYTLIVTHCAQIENTQSICAPFQIKKYTPTTTFLSAKRQHPSNMHPISDLKKKKKERNTHQLPPGQYAHLISEKKEIHTNSNFLMQYRNIQQIRTPSQIKKKYPLIATFLSAKSQHPTNTRSI